VNIIGLMDVHLRASGKIIRCMAMGFIIGKMEGIMKVNFRMIKSTYFF